MITYLRTQEKTIEAATLANIESYGTHVEYKSFNCECGESFAAYLIDSYTLNTLEIFIYCESCYLKY